MATYDHVPVDVDFPSETR